ncbi:S8 family serine peptidase [Novosphingobium sp. 9]|uniref:S8 family serine peptidase n=1 Tax=Novosphingobium sp. 9 TaxID=2025349 RepID=UPI0021B59F9E|nr:S8 family serine peptidase [Novosphingobium sp. 9]
MRRRAAIWATMTTAIATAALLTPPLHAQLVSGLPTGGALDPGTALGQVRDGVKGALDDIASPLTDPLAHTLRDATSLARERLQRLARFVSRHKDSVEWDEDHQPAVRGEVLLLDPDPTALATAKGAGYTVIENGTLDGLGIAYARLRTPDGQSLARAVDGLRKALPGREISADQLHFPAGASTSSSRETSRPSPSDLPRGGTVGVIDGGFGTGSPQSAARIVAQRGFAQGAPRVSDHAAAIASLLAGAGTARLYDADVYGSDPAGGNALAIARALGWMQQEAVPVVSISLVGPANPLLARAVAAAQQRGMTIVAAVGNDGAAAPPPTPPPTPA